MLERGVLPVVTCPAVAAFASPARFDLVFSAGRRPLREAADEGRLADALPGFCELFE